MAQPNVAREPSMDEILASIRKIIENNEANPDLAADADDGSFDISTDESADFAAAQPVVERFDIAAARPSLIVPQPIPDVVETAPAPEAILQGGQPALSLADVAARVRAASERHVAANREVAGREPVSIEPATVTVREQSPLVTARMAATANRPTAPVEMPAEPVASVVPKIEAVPPRVEPVRVPEPVAAAPVRDEPVEQPAPQAASRDLAALLSPAIGDRVAESFSALAIAVDAGPRRSFDDIAEEMLRPMLQDWLDDNLPTLVERLVREEIERVARGPRR